MDEKLIDILSNIKTADDIISDAKFFIRKWIENELDWQVQKELAFFTDEEKEKIINRITKKTLEEVIDKIEKLYRRTCDECGRPMIDGYCVDWGSEYYCSEKCLHKHYTEEERKKMYDNWNSASYRTEREDED